MNITSNWHANQQVANKYDLLVREYSRENHQFQVKISVTNSICQANLSKGISLRISLCTQLLNHVITIDRNSSFNLSSLRPPPSANKILHNPSDGYELFHYPILCFTNTTLL